MDLKKYIRDVPDFPQKGIIFKDITPVLNDAALLDRALALMWPGIDDETAIDKIIGIESRGFIFGAVLAQFLGCAFVPVRKEGKLPHVTLKQEYTLEYGETALEIHDDALSRGDRVVIVDDLLATGGTLRATCKLVELLGAEVLECAVVIELSGLEGREKLDDYEVYSIIQYD